MKSFLVKLVLSHSIKTGIAYAAQVATLVVNIINAILAGDGLSDERRGQLANVMRGAIAVRDFLNRLSEIIGAPSLLAIKQHETDWILEKSATLDRITDSL